MGFIETWLAPLFYFVDPTKRLFFVYSLASIIFAVAVLFCKDKKLVSSIEAIANPRVWLHRSSKIDFQLMFFNSILKTLLFIGVGFSAVVVSKFTGTLLRGWFPNFETSSWSYEKVILYYTVASFMILDFARFFQHYLFHKIPFLWRFHKIHHSAEVMTPVTLYRTHPVESVISTFRQIIVLGMIAGFFTFYTQSLIGAYMIFGVNAFDFAFNFLGSNLRHSHIWLSFGPLNYIFVSPAQHQIHHSRALKHRDKNIGFALSIWDLLFGTFYQVGKKEFLIFGIGRERHKDLLQTLMAPFKF